MYGMINTHKVDNSVPLITSGCNTAVENLPMKICEDSISYSC